MSVVFESEYQGRRHAAFERPGPGEPLTLYPVGEGQLREAVAGGGDLARAVADIRAAGGAVTVEPGDPQLRPLPPLLPTVSGDALLSGFMGTHKSKFGGESAPAGAPFVPPKWFFKGFGSWLRLPDETLTVPAEPVALIEEPEVLLVYVNDARGEPRYAGYTFGNDLCDIGLHRQDPGYNPYCKLCDTAVSPWLFLGEPPATVTGRVTIERDGAVAWEGNFDCGADALYHPVRDMVDHLFTFPAVRRPGLVNYVLLGADQASFHDGFRIADGDRVTIDVKSHGVVLSNPIAYGTPPATP
ncbi:fumarylacetoacetate (FAA) hydrolase [Streptomyces uncialis]|uniref:Fumarylacetoacetate (FAA) hydrolase family protein n=1 Tax=Streptomyces uncialis TaxID=1048205 RepID=A0A1Q4VAI4_9ACTN|nr:fumarylacetoacetate (FAA) hydrolase [Streptomyces uncialis]OKH94846.1 fumarylacetoacetate (FAA) hydrolase family protein [Streptomyces uncialis]